MVEAGQKPSAGHTAVAGEEHKRVVVDQSELRRALGRFATGITIVTTSENGELEGLTANSFTSVSLDPPLILWSLRNEATALPTFMRSEFFAVNVLGSHQHQLSRRFASSKTPNKFVGIEYETGIANCPVLADSLATFECSVFQRVPAGDHVIFIGKVERLTHQEGEPLLFSAGQYWVPTLFEAPNPNS